MAPSRVSNGDSDASSSADVSMIDAPTAATREYGAVGSYLMRVSITAALGSALSRHSPNTSLFVFQRAF
jgi:hypothetical protein